MLGNWSLRRTWLALAGACLGTLLLAGDAVAGSLTVQVVDCSTDGMSGATVVVAPAPPTGVAAGPGGGTLTTDLDGVATFRGLSGSYTITVTCPGAPAFSTTVFVNPLYPGDEKYLVLQCCSGKLKLLDSWTHDPRSGGNTTTGAIGQELEKTDWEREFADLHVRLVDCNGNPFPLPFQARLSRNSPDPRAFAPARQAAAGGDAVYRMLSPGTYTVSVYCPPNGPAVFATVTLAANTTATVVLKCPATTCRGLRAGQSWGWQETIEQEHVPGGRRYRSTPQENRTPIDASGQPLSLGTGAKVDRRIDEAGGLETLTIEAAGRTVDVNVPAGWRDSNRVLITVVEREEPGGEKERRPAGTGASISGIVTEVDGQRAEVGTVLQPLIVSAETLLASGLIFKDASGKIVARADVAGQAGRRQKPTRVPRIAQNGRRLYLPAKNPLESRTYSISPNEGQGARPVNVLAATDDGSVIELPRDFAGAARITEQGKDGAASEYPVHVLGIDLALAKAKKEAILARGQRRKVIATLTGTQGLEKALEEVDAHLVCVATGGVTVAPERVPIGRGKARYEFMLTGTRAGTFGVEVSVVESPKSSPRRR